MDQGVPHGLRLHVVGAAYQGLLITLNLHLKSFYYRPPVRYAHEVNIEKEFKHLPRYNEPLRQLEVVLRARQVPTYDLDQCKQLCNHGQQACPLNQYSIGQCVTAPIFDEYE